MKNVRTKWTIEDLKKHAESKGGKCLSDIFLTTTTKYLWEDKSGNQWWAAWHPIKSHGKWSPYEAKEKQRNANLKYNIEHLHKFAESKGGKCLSTEYTKSKDKYKWMDSENRIFEMTWECVLAGQWSPHEKADKLCKLKTKYNISELHDFAQSKDGKCLSTEYKKTTDYYEWQDSKGKIFKRTWYDVKKSNHLKYYNPISSGHQDVINFINSLGNFNIEINKKGIIGKKELDIYLPVLKIAIEYNGVMWHHDGNKDRKDHYEKYKLCKNIGIELIQIFDTEWLQRNQQVKNFLRSKLGKNDVKIFARKCIIKEVPKDEGKKFLEDNHILGKVNYNYAYGLYYKDELVSLISLGKHHRGLNQIVLNRYIVKGNVTVIGGLSKLVNHAYNKHGEFYTFIDNRYSTGDNWLKNGWKLQSFVNPDYFYIHLDTKSVVSKQSRKKSVVNTPFEMTELQHAELDGLVRIYDAGKLKLLFNNYN